MLFVDDDQVQVGEEPAPEFVGERENRVIDHIRRHRENVRLPLADAAFLVSRESARVAACVKMGVDVLEEVVEIVGLVVDESARRCDIESAAVVDEGALGGEDRIRE